MEFYKLFHKRTNYHSLLEWIDRGFRPGKWKLYDEKVEKAYHRLKLPFFVLGEIMKDF